MDASLTTPYGPPSEDAYIIPVPKDCVGLVIGKGGETIKMLQERSGARRV
jgi:transcription antitermination factor NusA-like protein